MEIIVNIILQKYINRDALNYISLTTKFLIYYNGKFLIFSHVTNY